MNLEDVDGHTTGGGELLVADVALEVLSFLVLNQYLLVLELSVAIVAPYLRRRSLLLLSHSNSNSFIRFRLRLIYHFLSFFSLLRVSLSLYVSSGGEFVVGFGVGGWIF